jgi:N-acetylglutamate synthase-like GNAT family acetyltransferase
VISLEDITIRTNLHAGDIGYITYLHGIIYQTEYDYGIEFESYVASGLHEFYQQYEPTRNRVWVCEHKNTIVGFLLLMNRGDAAQLRYFLIEKAYRGIGLGKKIMKLYMDFYHQCGYKSSYLWTTSDLSEAATLYKRFGFELVEEHSSSLFGRDVIEQKYELHSH